MALRFSKRLRTGRWERPCRDIPFDELNMQLVGSGGASGTMRCDAMGPNDDPTSEIAIHTCDVSDTTAYARYPGGHILATDPRADIDGFVSDPCNGQVEAVIVTHERSQLVAVNDAGRRLVAELDKVRDVLNRRANDSTLQLTLLSRSQANKYWIIAAASDTAATRYYLHEPFRQGSLSVPRMLLAARPRLEAFTLAATSAVTIPARDGTHLPGYLTPPPGAAAKPGPLALVLHGGPNARDYAGFDALTQLLATRGIGVLTLNYRGSTGFGTRFYRLGMGDLMGMHTDVEDARCWAIENHVADPNRIAIVGASWGGLLSLGGATGMAKSGSGEDSQPRYAACVAIVPLVAVGAANTSPAFRSDPLVAQYWKAVYGKAVSTQLVAAQALSPLYRMKEMRGGTQLLLVHGERDPRVPRDHGDAVALAAQRQGIVGTHLTYAAEGHSIRRESNQLHLWHAVERFLCRVLALPAPPALNPELVKGHTCTVHWDEAGLM